MAALRKNASRAAIAKYARRNEQSLWNAAHSRGISMAVRGGVWHGREMDAWYALKRIADTLEGKETA